MTEITHEELEHLVRSNDVVGTLAAFADIIAERDAAREDGRGWQTGRPPEGDEVLVSVHRKNPESAVYDSYRVMEARWYCGRGWIGISERPLSRSESVTHWRLLPNPVIPEAHDDLPTP